MHSGRKKLEIVPLGSDESTKAALLRRIAISYSHTRSFFSSKNGPTWAILADPVVVSDIPGIRSVRRKLRD